MTSKNLKTEKKKNLHTLLNQQSSIKDLSKISYINSEGNFDNYSYSRSLSRINSGQIIPVLDRNKLIFKESDKELIRNINRNNKMKQNKSNQNDNKYSNKINETIEPRILRRNIILNPISKKNSAFKLGLFNPKVSEQNLITSSNNDNIQDQVGQLSSGMVNKSLDTENSTLIKSRLSKLKEQDNIYITGIKDINNYNYNQISLTTEPKNNSETGDYDYLTGRNNNESNTNNNNSFNNNISTINNNSNTIIASGRHNKSKSTIIYNTKNNNKNDGSAKDYDINWQFIEKVIEQETKKRKMSPIRKPTEPLEFKKHQLTTLEQLTQGYPCLQKLLEADGEKKKEISKNQKEIKSKIEDLKNEMNKNKHSSKDFISKAREIAIMNYHMKLNEDAEEDINERYRANLRSITKTYERLKKFKEDVLDKMEEQLLESVKKLDRLKDREMKKKINAIQIISNLKNDIAKKIGCINNLKNEKRRLENWILFIVSIKIGNFKYLIQAENNGIETSDIFDKLNPQSSNNETKMHPNAYFMRSTKNIHNIIDFENNVNGHIIFDDIDDFFAKLAEPENRNLKLLKKLNDCELELKNLRLQERRELEEFEEENRKLKNSHLPGDFSFNEKEKYLKKQLYNLKKQNVELTETLKYIEEEKYKSSQIKKNKSSKKNIFPNFNKNDTNNIKPEDMVYEKVLKIYEELLESLKTDAIYNEIKPILTDFKHVKNKELRTLSMIALFEHLLNYLYSMTNKFRRDPDNAKKLKEIKLKFTLEFKRKKEIERKKMEAEKDKQKKIKIEQHKNKIYFLPLKKIDDYPYQKYFINKEKKPKVIKSNEGIEDFLDLD